MLVFSFFFIFTESNENIIWGDDEDEPYIAFKGKKPVDVQMKGEVSFWLKGDGCENYASQSFAEKLRRNGKLYVKYEYDFSDDPGHYELRLPYQNVSTNSGCTIKLNTMEVTGFNRFSDSLAHVGVRTQPKYNSKQVILSPIIIEARHCNAQIYQNTNKSWGSYISCEYFNNLPTTPSQSRLSYYDFSQFPNKTEIEFNIYAGELYRSEPLDEAKLRRGVGGFSSERDITSGDKKTSLLALLRKKIQDGKQK